MMMEGLTAALIAFAISVVNLLPPSPFLLLEDMVGDEFSDILRMVNWFIPFGTLVGILEVWLSGILVYYAVQIVLRWVKVIG